MSRSGVMPPSLLGDPGEQPVPGGGVHQARERRGQPHPPRQEAHGVVGCRADPPGVVLAEELRLVARHVDVDGTVGLASLAGQAQVERLAYLRGAPAVLDDLTVRHLEEQPGAAPGRVHLLAGGPVARAHDSAVRRQALADADAAPGGTEEAVGVVGERERRLGADRRSAHEHPQVVVQLAGSTMRWGFSRPSGSHAALNSPNAAIMSRRIHPVEQFGARLTVAVFAGQRAVVGRHEVGGVLHEAAESRTPGSDSRSKSMRTWMQPSPKCP